ncbi:hypothetical protein [Acinetobacter zhairhuonensis]|uniref:hypothetical protein n=1 Tax=Acinetobacter sp. A7.4 TaxID=2919921 RepID=UPI001F4E53F6|nr:hypothetical protein [Acinetobacter sp. A7.4]MCJ8160235.1 hypothetical protein [Acinetobacter sp. A7.4]
MSDINLDFLDETLNQNEKKKRKIKKIRIGYKLYEKFMGDHKFAEEVVNSALDLDKRCYRGIKIKITHDDYELTFLTND